jgi:hypothetical protein
VGHSFESLRSSTVEQQLGGLEVLVLDLDALIRIKKQPAREKDLGQLAVLRRTFEEKNRKP